MKPKMIGIKFTSKRGMNNPSSHIVNKVYLFNYGTHYTGENSRGFMFPVYRKEDYDCIFIYERLTINPNFKEYTKQERKI